MGKFKKKTKTSQEIPTAALPDIIFMLLFFFMVTTVMKENSLLIQTKMPKATQLSKLERKSLTSYINIGKPYKQHAAKFGTEPRIQVNDVIIDPDGIAIFVEQERDKLIEDDKKRMTITIKADKDTKMGIVTDVQEELRKVNALKVLYNTPPRGTAKK